MKETVYRPPKGMRCVCLDPDAKRCRFLAWRGVQFHGNPEYCDMWLIAYFCRKHYEEAP